MACSWSFAQLCICVVWSDIWGIWWPYLDKTVSCILKTFIEMLWIAVKCHVMFLVKENIVCLCAWNLFTIWCIVEFTVIETLGNHILNFQCHFDLLVSLHICRFPQWDVTIQLCCTVTRKRNVCYTVLLTSVTDSILYWTVWLSHRYALYCSQRDRTGCVRVMQRLWNLP